MPRQAQPRQAKPQSSGSEQSGSAESRRKPPLVMVRGPGMVLSDELFELRRALGPRRRVNGGTGSKRVLFLYGRPGGLCVSLGCEDLEKGIERARPIIEEAAAAGRVPSNSLAALERWVANRCQAGKVERIEPPRVDSAEVIAEVSRAKSTQEGRRHLPPPLPFTQWARGPSNKFVLQCAVYCRNGKRLPFGLKTADPKAARPRMRLLLWHALRKGELLGDEKHEAWIEYGGRMLRQLSAC
jgi:hypothetical protein